MSTYSIKTRSKTRKVEANSLYLPDDCWEHVFKFIIKDDNINRCYMKSLSIVSKQFLSITNTLKFTLTICKPIHLFLHSLLQRFTNLTSLHLSFFFDDYMNKILIQISRFPLKKLTSLNISKGFHFPAIGLRAFSKKITTLTSLTCSVLSLCSNDLFLIAECFPLLEELDLSNPTKFKDDCNSFIDGVKALSLSLSKLRKINLFGHHYINDQFIFHLFNSGKLLQEAIMSNSVNVTDSGVVSALRQRPTLKGLSFSNIKIPEYDFSYFIDSLVSLKGLTCLDLICLKISDELLFSIAREGLPLKRVMLRNCKGFSYDGIHCLISKCQLIQHLNLEETKILKDYNVDNMSLFLGNLVSVNLDYCWPLTELSLLALVRRCPLLHEIYMRGTCVGRKGLDLENYSASMNFVVNPHVKMKSLHLSSNSRMTNKTIKLFASICPNIELLDVSYCKVSEAKLYI